MSSHCFSSYLLAIDVLDSREVLRLCTAADWPNLKPKDRKDLHKRLSKAASPVKPARKPIESNELASIFGVSNVRR